MKRPVILDGGFSTELENLGYDVNADPLWGAGAVKTDPQTVVQVHKNYVSAGSHVITTSSYQASVEGFVSHLGVSVQEALNLIQESVRLAGQAIQHQKRHVQVAGSLGPYGATLHDGSEYTGNYTDQPQWTVQALKEWHRGRLESLLDAGADLLALETQPALQEAIALMELLRERPNARAWLSFSCAQDGLSTAHGEPLKRAVKECLQQSSGAQLLAVGVNCCSPHLVGPLLEEVAQALREVGPSPMPSLLAYPNSGEIFHPGSGWEARTDMLDFGQCSLAWWETDVTWLGGCCRTGPKQVAQIVQALSSKVTASSTLN